jgi:hypothetical protein
MRFEPGLVPIIYPATTEYDTYFDCHQGFIAPLVGLGYYRVIEDSGRCHYVISHILSGFRLPGDTSTEQQAQSVISALAECGIDWWLSQDALRALPEWKNIEEVYDNIVKQVCIEK